ncbi:MAG: DUF115 domain-containing protein [ANME-2 cluster archaeon]|nr:DUF115 domain-containing protein [ANME-2 cluster archaeon]MDF1532249.1 DUF115 domain-containing protein [ANME-2 cluster archaeon]
MKFEDWEPIYHEIIKDMGYDRTQDEQAAGLLSGLLFSIEPSRLAPVRKLTELVQGKDVLVCGNAPSLADELADVDPSGYCIIAADGATAHIMDAGLVPHIIVTDLDGAVASEIEASNRGAVMVVHAHGDNVDTVQAIVPGLHHIIGSTQAAPLENVYNFGGFTDGDRCVFLAVEFDAASVTMIGFDFNDKMVTPMKARKLDWARRLIEVALE